jgi:hypothetical protein
MMKTRAREVPEGEDAFEAARKAFFGTGDSKAKPNPCQILTQARISETPATHTPAPDAAAESNPAEPKKPSPLSRAS